MLTKGLNRRSALVGLGVMTLVQQTLRSNAAEDRQMRVKSGRASLATEVIGRGQPVVFLHAFPCDRRMWRHQMDGISPTNMAIAYDRRGYQASQAEPEDFSAAADVIAVLDSVAPNQKAVLVGCSFGGKIAIDAALLHPSRISGLVLIAPNVDGSPAIPYSPEVKAMLDQQSAAEKASDLDRLNAIKARLWLDGPMAKEGRVGGAARQLFLDMNSAVMRSPPMRSTLDNNRQFDRLVEITVPTLALWGDLDFPHIQERCRLLVKALPHAEAKEIAGSAHLPSMDDPEVVTGEIAAFLRRIV